MKELKFKQCGSWSYFLCHSYDIYNMCDVQFNRVY